MDGRDRVHFLSVGWILDPTAAITGTFGVDSDAWADLGDNPFVPAPSANLTTYEEARGVRKPSQEFTVAEVRSDSELRITPGWALEDATFSVNFTDEGAKTFPKNVLQYRIVRDDRAIASVQNFAGIQQTISSWGNSLQSTALFAVLRGWQASLLGHDQPDFRPARGSFLAALAALTCPAAAALDPLALGPDSTLREDLRLFAAAYFNRFGLTSGDELLDPSSSYGRTTLVEKVLSLLVRDGIASMCFDEVQVAALEPYGSPHFTAPPTVEIDVNGGGGRWTAGVYDLLERVKADRALNFPADWALGLAGLMSSPESIDREMPVARLACPVAVALITSLAGATAEGTTFAVEGVNFDELTAPLYGRLLMLQEGDELELLPSGRLYEITYVGTNLETTANIDVSGQTHWRLWLKNKLAEEMIRSAPFFTYAFGVYATVAADVTFLANDLSWQEVVDAGLSQEVYDEAIAGAFLRSMAAIARNMVAGNLPALSVQSEAARRVPARRYGVDWSAPGAAALPMQGAVGFPTEAGSSPLITWHLTYLRSLIARLDGLDDWVRFGTRDLTPAVVGATSLQVTGRGVTPGVTAGSFRARDGSILMLWSCWLTYWLASFPQRISSGILFSDRDIDSGYWTAVHVLQSTPNFWAGEIIDLDDDPDGALVFDLQMGQIETKAILVYEQEVIVRRDGDANEVDRVLPVRRGRSVAAALAVVALDVVKGGEGIYLIVLEAGAVADSLDITDIPGASVTIQAAADESPEIGEVP